MATPIPPSRTGAVGRLLSVLLVVSAASGCVLDKRGESSSARYQAALRSHGEKIALMESALDNTETRLVRLEEASRARSQQEVLKLGSLEEIRAEVGRLRGDFEVLRHDYDTFEGTASGQLDDAAFRLEWLETRAAQLESSLGVPMPPPPERPEPVAEEEGTESGGETDGPEVAGGAEADAGDEGITDPGELIDKAEKHLAAGRAKAAETVLDRFLELHPNHKREPEALYRRAEAAFNMKDYSGAVLRFQDVIDRHKKSVWAAYAMYRQGECFEAQGQRDNARLFWEDVVRLWPDTKAARLAKKKLGK
jgi:tol-pal system protein YbgF